MNNTIYPCLWFNGQAKEAADFYCAAFDHSQIFTDTPLVVKFEIEGKSIMGLNGGPMFKINPAISLFVFCQSDQEIEKLWSYLLKGGRSMMALDEYPWSRKYGWVVDKFGMTWQLMLGELPASGQKIMISLLFVGEQYGKAQAAMKLYTSTFPNSNLLDVQLYHEGEGQPRGTVKFGDFSLMGESMGAMDGFGEYEFAFNEGVSLVVECETQQEIDHYWNTLTERGQESMCGWLKDEFGVSWQIVPKILSSLITDPEKGPRAMQALMKMKKLDIETLLNA